MRGIISETPYLPSICGHRAVGEAIAFFAAESIMSKFKYLLPVLVLTGTSMLIVSTSYAKPEYVKTSKKACVFCHIDAKAKPKELTEAGKFYKEHNNSLDGFKAAK
jgi:hypothetical protein